MKLGRKLTAPLSAVLLIIVAGLAFTHLQPRSEYPPPPILDPQFDLWVSDPDLGRKPLVWQLEYARGVGDQVALQKTVLEGRKALEIQLFQDGVDDRRVYVYLRQTIDGARLRALFSKEVDVWIFLEASCTCKSLSASQSSIFGIETNDGEHMLTFIFSGPMAGANQLSSHRTVSLSTQAGEWVYQRIDVAKEYDDAQWIRPDRLSFSIILEAPGRATGWHVGYVSVTTNTPVS